MRTKLYMVVFLLVLILVGIIPWIDGYVFKQNYINFLSTLGAERQTKIKVLEYHLGWFGSTAKISAEPVNLNADSSLPAASHSSVMIFDQTIKHGPYLFDDAQNAWTFAKAAIHTEVSFSPMLKTILVTNDPQGDMHFDTLVTLSDVYASQFSTPTFVVGIIPSNMGKVTWQGMKGNIVFYLSGNQLHQVVGNIDSGIVNVQMGTNSAVLGETNYQYDMTYQSGIWLGKQTFSLPQVSVGNAGSVIGSMRGFNLDVVSTTDTGKFYNIVIQSSVNSLATSEITLNPSTIKISMEHFNLKGMADFIRVSRGIGKTMIATQGQEHPQMSGFLPSAITPTSVVNENINIVTSSGKLISTGQIYWPKDTVLPTMIEDIAANAGVKIDVRASAALVNAMIDMLYPQASSASSVSANAAQIAQQPTEAGLIEQIDILTNQNKIPLDVSFQLKDLVRRHLALDVFTANIDPFVLRKDISADVAAQLKARYAILHPAPLAANKPGAPTPAVVVQPAAVVQVPTSPAEIIKGAVADWIKSGCITQDKDDYVTTITREQGMFKCNGVPFTSLNIPVNLMH